MKITLGDKKKILQEVNKMRNGEVNELKSNLQRLGLSQTVIDDVYTDLIMTGIIKQGYDGLGKLRFHVTNFGENYYNISLSFGKIRQGFIDITNSVCI